MEPAMLQHSPAAFLLPTSSSSLHIIPHLRRRLLDFLLHALLQLQVPPVVKYTALSFFADRFLPSLRRRTGEFSGSNWLLSSLSDSNLQLFALISIWISSKIHLSRPLSVKNLKALADRVISDQHFSTRDFVEAEVVFLEVLEFDIGASGVAVVYLEDLLIQFRALSKLGELVSLDVCMEVMDLLYESEDISTFFSSPYILAASVLVTTYLITVPEQQWEFPLLPWVTFTTSHGEEEVGKLVTRIVSHILKCDAREQMKTTHGM